MKGKSKLNRLTSVRFARSITRTIVESMITHGHLKAKDLSDRKLLFDKVLKCLPKKDKDLFFVIIHQPTLLHEAEQYAASSRYELAYVFYATYFEHFINEILSIWIERKKRRQSTCVSLIRHTSIEGKFTWLLDLLQLPAFKKSHWETIKRISDKRNAFIHYKYTPEAANSSSDIDVREWKTDYPAIRSAIAYTKRYRSRLVFAGRKKKVMRLVR